MKEFKIISIAVVLQGKSCPFSVLHFSIIGFFS